MGALKSILVSFMLSSHSIALCYIDLNKSHPKFHYKRKTKKERQFFNCRSVLALPIFPGRCQPSIVGRNELNYRVRNGNGWTLILISTNFVFPITGELIQLYEVSRTLSRKNGDPYRIRTDVNGVRGRCLNHLTNGPLVHLRGLEPRTH